MKWHQQLLRMKDYLLCSGVTSDTWIVVVIEVIKDSATDQQILEVTFPTVCEEKEEEKKRQWSKMNTELLQ